MKQKLKAYMLFPFLLFAAAFVMDKQFFIGDYPAYFLRTASFLNYEHKEVLLDQLEAYLKQPDHKKVMVMFGSSRTMSFSNQYIEKTYPDWVLYNFSVPGGVSDYYYYYMELFQKRNIHPDYIYFAVDPMGFNRTPAIAMDEVMLNGLSFPFIIQNSHYYSMDEIMNYIAKSMFWSFRNHPKLDTILERWKNNSYQARQYKQFIAISYADMIRERGSVPYGLDQKPVHENADDLVKSGRDLWKAFFVPFTMSEGQIYFTERSLHIAHEMGIPAKLLWARVGPEVRRLMDQKAIQTPDGNETTIRQLWQPLMDDMARRNGSAMLDMNYGDSIACDMYYDSSHMAGICFNEFTDYLMKDIKATTSELEKGGDRK